MEGENTSNNMKQQHGVPIRATARPLLKKVQVVYYLTRNGHLEHPHYMDVSLIAHHQLRLRDVIHRLTALRGKGMPSMYSWSCKRSYKNGYVWNDLSENDVIHPAADGAEYVLKGSEIIENCPEEQRFQPIQVYNRQVMEVPRNHNSKCSTEAPIMLNNNEMVDYSRYGDQNCGGQEEYEEEEKTSYTSSTTPQSRCSRGVATDELDESESKPRPEPKTKPSPDPHYITFPCNKANPSQTGTTKSEDVVLGNHNPRSALGRNSVLLQLISCGNMAKSVPEDFNLPPKEVTPKRELEVSDEGVEEKVMIRYMSENPRFGNLQSEEKEYFSGSIVEAIAAEQPKVVLKRSNSCNEERSSHAKGMEEAAAVGEIDDQKKREKAAAKGKCISLLMDGFLKRC